MMPAPVKERKIYFATPLFACLFTFTLCMRGALLGAGYPITLVLGTYLFLPQLLIARLSYGRVSAKESI
jgi:hypothetical protein